jgi:hypothetical protein
VDYPYLLYQIAIGEPIGEQPEIDYDRRTETPIIGLLATLEEIANDETKLKELRTVAEEFKRIPAAEQKREQFQLFLDQLRSVARPSNVRDYLRQMFEKHTDAVSDVFHGDDPLPALGVLYPLALMLKHGKLSTAMLVSEQELPGQRPKRRLIDYLRPRWSTLLLTGALFVLSVLIDRFEPTRKWIGWLLGWPRHAGGATAGAGFAFYNVLNFVYLYVLAAIVLWLRGQRKRG